MASVNYYTDPHLAMYSQPSMVGPGVCRICRSGPGSGYDLCHSCNLTTRQVSRPITKVVPISLYTLSSQYWNILRYYKDGSDIQRSTFTLILAATISRFTTLHWECISGLLGDEPSGVTVVPSTRGRLGEHPLAMVVRRSGLLRGLYEPMLMRGPGIITHRQASDDGFIVTANVRGKRILLIEDTFTSGARTQSAASALQLAGASTAVVVAGRVISPDWNDNCRKIWRDATASTFSFDKCCLRVH
jgi:hypothetical protein